MKKITLHLFGSFFNYTYTLENRKQLKINSAKNYLFFVLLVLISNLNYAQEITYQMTSNIQGSEDVTAVTELNDGDLNTYKKISAANSMLNIDTATETQLISYTISASSHTDILFDSGLTENATGTEAMAIGSGLVGNSVIVGGAKNTLKATLTGKGVELDEFTFSSLIKIASGTTGVVTLLSLETASDPAEHVVFYYDIAAEEFSIYYKFELKPGKAFTISPDTQYQMSMVITNSKLNVFIDGLNVASWKIGGDGIPADAIEMAYLGYDSFNSAQGAMIEYDGSYFFNEKLFANNQSQIHDDTKILGKVPVAGSEFEFGARFWSLYGLVDALDEFDNPIVNKVLIDEQTNQSFTSGEEKSFDITENASYQEYELSCKGFAFSQFKLIGTTLAIDKFSINNYSITKDLDGISIGSDKLFRYQIYDLTGKLIKEQQRTTLSSHIQLTKNRIYILKMQFGNEVVIKKIIL
ncbi:T9SS type A sorting domain-containing protein [Algibacter mikhailovii]|uniref:T9SS type A sorting domain-containing protein n=1 Tax=Algibacter mikhailovii TaxID=425498 RepID=A0A918RAM0_9FLAO|nr:T9SS type A sorting domain-containing protein [Algibacter mikhailovii]GGZ92154.1 hypothetical protein GCM10007028_33280 [Algibacter mikhailovii]